MSEQDKKTNTDDHVTMKSDNTLILLNGKIDAALKLYVPEESDIRFDMVDKEFKPQKSTYCVFLYDIQEALELRQGKARQFDATTGVYAPRQVHMRCCYLLTLWENSEDANVKFNAPAVVLMNSALNGLLNMQFGDDFPAVLRVVAPSEHLSSLGNFWQSLGDKPRLCLNFNVTIPVQLGLRSDTLEEKAPAVRKTELEEITPGSSDVSGMPQDSVTALRRLLLEKVIASAALDVNNDLNALRAQLTKLQFQKIVPDQKTPGKKTAGYDLEGVVDELCLKIINSVLPAVIKESGQNVVAPLKVVKAPERVNSGPQENVPEENRGGAA